MARPKVSISLLNGQLGQVTPSDDGVAALVMTGVATANIALGESKKITSVQEAEDLLLDADYDVTNTTNVYKSIVDFYKEGGEGSELWIMIVAKATLMASICDLDNAMLKKLLDDAGGKVRIAAVTRVPDGAYVAEYTNQIDSDVIDAAQEAQALAEDFATKFKPVRIILDGRDFQGNTATLGDLKDLYAYNRVQIALFTDVSASKNAAVGLLLGRYANKPVQRNPGRVKDGAVGKHGFDTSGQFVTTEPIEEAYLTGQAALIESMTEVQQDAVHDKGYVSVRKYASKTGYFFTDDPTATAADDDYNSFARGRVIDKAIVITNEVYTEELLDDLDTDENGRIDAAIIKDYQSKIKKEIDARMTTPGEISGCRVVIDPKQNVLATNTVNVDLFVRPKFYSKEIAVRLGFENPANA